jgi:hypothetical protein
MPAIAARGQEGRDADEAVIWADQKTHAFSRPSAMPAPRPLPPFIP